MRAPLAALTVSAALACVCRAAPPGAAVAADARAKAVVSRETAAVAAAMGRASRAVSGYRISPADLLSVTLYDVQDMNRKVRVDAGGMISLPLVGAVKVGGRTLAQAERLIDRKLASFVVRPQVSLFIDEYGSRLIYVMGEVQKPGSYSIPAESRMTVLEAISTAGGFTPVAAQDRARVLRYVNGESMNYTIDVRSLTRDAHKDKDLVLEPNDVVFIPQSLF